jgi:plastocyanin
VASVTIGMGGIITRGYFFVPNTITVVIGVNNTVHWINNETVTQDAHTVTSDTSGLFDSGRMLFGATFDCTFTTPGTYQYHCVYHLPSMVGTVIVRSP